MSLMPYYRTTDERIVQLEPADVAALHPVKQATLKAYTIDPLPTLTATQYAVPGPVVVSGATARKTWEVRAKAQEQLDAEAFAVLQSTTLEQARTAYSLMKAGSGTAGERLARVERVCAWLLRQQFGREPT